jgi:hypothetical protein
MVPMGDVDKRCITSAEMSQLSQENDLAPVVSQLWAPGLVIGREN